ncbi:hypothetical protein B5X24_HaOG212538 [Helicoverpa armigera]|uniref:Uncharacterized protein n=1 Tax=Helicoverpa armigera TaxID=29058 RepID=A0A2W1BD15_HELAM|nr:hypothetical protein B5X24_HaOG212538 [Helicoverpa armigera]
MIAQSCDRALVCALCTVYICRRKCPPSLTMTCQRAAHTTTLQFNCTPFLVLNARFSKRVNKSLEMRLRSGWFRIRSARQPAQAELLATSVEIKSSFVKRRRLGTRRDISTYTIAVLRSISSRRVSAPAGVITIHNVRRGA